MHGLIQSGSHPYGGGGTRLPPDPEHRLRTHDQPHHEDGQYVGYTDSGHVNWIFKWVKDTFGDA